MAYARERFADEDSVEFVRRVITRPSDGATEDHDTLAEAAFVEAEADGAFALSWEAHGLRYGIPASVDTTIADGHVAIANASRGAIPALRERYETLPWWKSPHGPRSSPSGWPRAAANRAARCWRALPAPVQSSCRDRAFPASTTAATRKSPASASSRSSARPSPSLMWDGSSSREGSVPPQAGWNRWRAGSSSNGSSLRSETHRSRHMQPPVRMRVSAKASDVIACSVAKARTSTGVLACEPVPGPRPLA